MDDSMVDEWFRWVFIKPWSCRSKQHGTVLINSDNHLDFNRPQVNNMFEKGEGMGTYLGTRFNTSDRQHLHYRWFPAVTLVAMKHVGDWTSFWRNYTRIPRPVGSCDSWSQHGVAAEKKSAPSKTQCLIITFKLRQTTAIVLYGWLFPREYCKFLGCWITPCENLGYKVVPPVISLFINPMNYSYIYIRHTYIYINSSRIYTVQETRIYIYIYIYKFKTAQFYGLWIYIYMRNAYTYDGYIHIHIFILHHKHP